MKKSIIFSVLGLISLFCIVVWGVYKIMMPQIAYVDNTRLFAEFKGKKDLEARLKSSEGKYKLELDSLQIRLYATNERFQTNQNNKALQDTLWQLKRLLDEKNEYYKQNLSVQIQQYDSQVWKQINQYVKEFGLQQGYDYILGNAESGSLMYTSSKNDITNDVLKFINKKYEGF